MCKTFLRWDNFTLSHHYDNCLLFKPSVIQTSLCITALVSNPGYTCTHAHRYTQQFPFNPCTRLKRSQTITRRQRRIWLWQNTLADKHPETTTDREQQYGAVLFFFIGLEWVVHHCVSFCRTESIKENVMNAQKHKCLFRTGCNVGKALFFTLVCCLHHQRFPDEISI